MTIGKQETGRNLSWQGWQVYAMATICLVVGIFVGYLARGSAPASVPKAQQAAPVAAAEPQPQKMPSMDDMKRMADKQVQPLLDKLQSDPKNADLLNQVGNVYRMTHQFKAAAEYYQKALDLDPKNIGARADLASCLFYEGNVDGAISQLEKSLTYDPKHAGTLYNLGMIRWQGKGDAAGAVASWQQLLKLNPDYDNKAGVQKLISEARMHKAKDLPQSQ